MIVRVFPFWTKATPDDPLAFVGDPPLPVFRPAPEEVREVHVSVAFSWWVDEGIRLAQAWQRAYPEAQVGLGGPAFHGPDNRPGEFVPGMYLAKGYTITSRGCTHACPFCAVHEREGKLRELPIRDGWIVLDNNLLACSPEHLKAVFAMLRRQPERIEFTGGLEAALVTPMIAYQLRALRVNRLFLAYDTPAQWEAVALAIRLLRAERFTLHHIACYVLAAFDPADTPDKAAARCEQVLAAGAMPFLMLYRSVEEEAFVRPDWRDWFAVRRTYMRPALMLAGGRRAELEAKR